MTERITNALGIKKGEFVTSLSLFLYLLLVIASYVVSKTVRDALFLSKFGALKLPYVYMGIAVCAGLVVAVYIRLGRRIKPHLLVSGTLAFFISNSLLFWWLFKFHFGWLYPVIYIWAGVFGVIAPMQVWMLSSLILTTRQAKRLYGFIGSGGLLGAIIGGLFTSWTVAHVGTENLLLAIAGFLAICVGLVNLIWMQTAKQSAAAETEQSPRQEEAPSSLRASVSFITRSRYLILITAIITISSIATTIVDYQFKAAAQQSLATKDQLTAFFGSFYGYLGIGAFVLQILLTSRLMRRLGVGFTIMLLPLGLILGSVALLSAVTLWTATLLKCPDQLFKHSIDKATVELLYLPVSAKIRAAVKSFIDSVIWRLADGVAGLILLVLTSVFSLGVRQVTLFNLGLMIVWLTIAYATKRRYVDALRAAISGHAAEPEAINIISPLTLPQSVNAAPQVETAQPVRVLHLVNAAGARAGAAGRAEIIKHSDIETNQGAAREVLEEMLGSREVEVRCEAARTLTAIENPSDFHYALGSLLQDPSAQVAGQALQSASKSGRLEVVPLIIAQLGHKATHHAAHTALVAYGSKIMGTLRDYLVNESTDLEIRQAIPQIIGDIGTQEAVDILTNNLNQKNPNLRLAVLKALCQLRLKSAQLQFTAARIRQALASELRTYYTTLDALHMSGSSGILSSQPQQDAELLRRSLKEKLNLAMERIFRLLGLIYTQHDLHRAYDGLLSADTSVRANSLEFLDNLLDPGDRQWLLPLVDDEVSIHDRLEAVRSINFVRRTGKLAALLQMFRTQDSDWGQEVADSARTRQLQAS